MRATRSNKPAESKKWKEEDMATGSNKLAENKKRVE